MKTNSYSSCSLCKHVTCSKVTWRLGDYSVGSVKSFWSCTHSNEI